MFVSTASAFAGAVLARKSKYTQYHLSTRLRVVVIFRATPQQHV